MKKLNYLLAFILSLLLIYSCTKESQEIAKDEEIRNFTQMDLLNCIRISSPQVSPDGQWVLYQQSIPIFDENRMNSEIMAVSINGIKTINLSNHPKSDHSAIWSPDGKQIAFISNRNGSLQIYMMDFPNGKPRKITKISAGTANLLWSPDSQYILWSSDVKIDQSPIEKYPNLKKAKVRIYDEIPVRHWDEWNDEYYQHIFFMPVKGGEITDILEGERYEAPLKPWGGREQIAFSPDANEIAYTSKKVQDYALSTNSDIYIYNIQTKETVNITEGMAGYDMDPIYSPDGKWIAFRSQEKAGFESDRIRLMLYDRNSGKITELTKHLDQWVEEAIWAPDSKSLYITITDSGTYQIYNIDLQGKFEKITNGQHNFGRGLSITPDGKELVYCKQNMKMPLEIYKLNLKSFQEQALTSANTKKFAKFNDITIEERWFTAIDGKKIHSWIIYPPDFDKNQKYPMLTFCQGGPQNMVSQVFHYRWNFFTMASHGYVIVAPNRRGLPGFGQQWNDAISQDWGGKAMQDILSVTDAMAEEPFIDKQRLGAIGASAGGYAVFWLAGNHNKRFKAFVAHTGVFNLVSMYGSTEELFFTNWENGGPYWEPQYTDNYKKHSPHEYAKNWDTPIMISTGELDYRVPYTQSLEAFTVAQLKKLPSKFVIFPTQGHLILSLQEAVLWYNEFFEFLDKYLMN